MHFSNHTIELRPFENLTNVSRERYRELIAIVIISILGSSIVPWTFLMPGKLPALLRHEP